MKNSDCVRFLQWALPQLELRWPGFRRVRSQVCKRIDRRRKELMLSGITAYQAYLETHKDEWKVLEKLCRISVSRFYRDKRLFDLIAEQILPQLCEHVEHRDEATLRCWSAGCASGEEAYTLSLLWFLRLRTNYPTIDIDILATDIDPHLIQRAEKACYQFSSLKELPEHWRARAFIEQGQAFCLQEEYKKVVNFNVDDIEGMPCLSAFHLVFCRNLVFTYFNTRRQHAFLEHLASCMEHGGALVIGAHETLPARTRGWKRWQHPYPVYFRN